jgi:UDP-GlcNAc:undecaprenyl-phosphate GlcNAc-1-phosphate transferase
LRDDIAPLAPLKKISGQIIASLIVIAFCDIRLQGMHGLFGIHSLSLPFSILFTLIAMLFIINAFNLIDGIDGLSSGLGIIASFVFGIVFYVYHDFLMAVLSLALCGALAGFLPYNFNKAKIFMGDTGTMTTGFILSIFSIHFLEIARYPAGHSIFSYFYAPVVVLAVLIVPITDMMRVFVIRISKFRSPFSPDRNHIHHRLLSLGFTDAQSALILFGVTIIFIGAAWIFRGMDPLVVFYCLMAAAVILSQIPFFISAVKFSGTATQK